jgi:hypothetical protein
MPNRMKRLCVLTIAVLALSLFAGLPAASARQADAASGATVRTASSPTLANYIPAPSCIYRFTHTHLTSKHVHLENQCGHTYSVKVVIAFGPDSACIWLPDRATATHSWSYGWPYALSRFDRLELC